MSKTDKDIWISDVSKYMATEVRHPGGKYPYSLEDRPRVDDMADGVALRIGSYTVIELKRGEPFRYITETWDTMTVTG